MKLLERHFEMALAAPDGIKKLRELILTLAMQGKLVPQDPADPPASELLKQIEAEKKKLLKEGKIKKQEPLPPIKPEEVPYEVPAGWEWVQLALLGEINPRNEADNDKVAAFVPMPLIFADYGTVHKYEERKWGEIKKGFTHFAENDVVLAKITPCYENRKSCVMKNLPNEIGAGTTELHVFRNTFSRMCPEYVLAFLKSPQFISNGIPKMTGSAGQKRVPKEYFAFSPFPLPPLAEQKRIVAKIDQLMVVCDKLEAERNERNRKRLLLHRTAMDQLLSAADAPSFATTWSFIARNFGVLYSVPENVVELKKAILQLAVMGKLVPQDPSDQPASELLKQIEAEKRRLVKEGKIKKQEPLPPIKPEELPYEVPAGWEWVRVQDLGFVLGGKRIPKGYDFSNVPTLYRYLTVTNMKDGSIVDNNEKYIDEATRKAIEKYIITKEDIYITIAGTIGMVGSIPDRYDGMNLTENASRLIFFEVNKNFLVDLLNSNIVQSQFHELTNKMAQPKLALRSILGTLIPLPPLAEQQRIVAKVDSLMALCDELAQQLKDATDKQTAILNAVVAGM